MKLRYTGQAPESDINMLASEWFKELFDQDETVVYLDADLMGGLKTNALWREYPDRVFNCGIQESNMVGVAAGLYLAGFKPYIHSFSPFAVRRTYDQLFISVAYGHKSVHVIGSDAGIMATDNGGTHMCFEDIALIRAIPGACIVDVSDAVMFHALLLDTKDRDGITYFRTPRRNLPDIYEKDTSFHAGKGKILTDGTDVTLIASGIMVATALEAQKALAAENISVRVVDPVTIKPLDEELVIRCAKQTGVVVTAENHNIIGGLGGCIAELLSERYSVPVLRLGVEDRFGQTGPADYLRECYGLTPEALISKVKEAIKIKGERK